MILCDIGNTSFHFFDEKLETDFKIFETCYLPEIFEPIYFISVNDNKRGLFLKKYPQALDLKDYCELNTNYSGLGIDRLVACLNYENGIIVDAGSAITVDIMEKNNHIGGFILPGVDALRNSYEQISNKLKADFEINVFLDKIPNCTKNAINYGILKSIILPIQEIAKQEKIYFTGGDGELIARFFKDSIFDEFIVFKGMKKIIKGIKC